MNNKPLSGSHLPPMHRRVGVAKHVHHMIACPRACGVPNIAGRDGESQPDMVYAQAVPSGRSPHLRVRDPQHSV